ncbi:amino acid/polyamine transporter I [Ilyonectria robusta]|uniref:amino acid/polyamine transporter I n=1 Tax=Ilyonectria robusta TaxID=1079257 RepID=UPI001E8E3449|nr:amino acid/polyamine transporter I [Ilyonectria robusta]KAH8714675.1 amino acid/polyamine transporter I [Ilyonectria robusta]
MAPADSIEMQPDGKDVAVDATKTEDGGSSVYNQTRTRRVFSFSQLFAFSLTYMSLWEGMCTNMYFALYNGGPQTFIFSFIIVFCGAISQAASLGEMASIQPVAGAQYHWTYHLAPPSVRRFATYVQGWATWFGYISLLAGIANVTIILLESMIQLNHPNYVPGGWHTSVLVIAMCVLQGLMNTYAFEMIPWIEMVAGVLHVCLFVVFAVVLGVMGSRHGGSFWLKTNTVSGWDDSYIAWNLGMLTCVWSFTGFDSAIHMSEETRKAKSAVPRAMFWSIFMNGVLGFIMVNVLLASMGSIDDALNSASPILTILLTVTGSEKATTAMITGLFVISFSVNLANIASVSRLTWAWSRDGGMPAYFAYVSPKHRVPIRSIVLTVFLVCALCLLNIGSSSYVAFGAITSLSSMALYISYAIAISSILYARFNSAGLKLGEWNLGRYGLYVNAFALVYTLYIIVFLPFPSTLPVTAANMNYCGPVMVFVLFVTLALWFLRAKKHWTGPNLTILDFVIANS